MTTLIYPIASSWILGEGWLYEIGFHDAAGACYIHMLGGVCGLVGTLVLGPRTGIFDKTTVNKLVKAANKRKKLENQNFYISGKGQVRQKKREYEAIYRMN